MAEQKVKLVDRGWDNIKKQAIKAVSGKVASVGWQGNSATEDHGGVTNVEVAAWMEFGTRDIPERPMLRQTFDKNLSKYEKEMKLIANTFYTGKDIDGLLLVLGERYRGDMIQEIRSRAFAEWAESTLMSKALQNKSGDVPLWDTGQLINASGVVVVKATERK